MLGLKMAISGKMRSGKDTLAQYAQEKYNMTPFSFGDYVKRDFHRENPSIPWDPKPRRGYQLHGQLKRYVHGEDYWVDQCFSSISRLDSIAEGYNITGEMPPLRPIITDLRQSNELKICKREGYVIIYLHSSEENRINRMVEDNYSLEDLNHETEDVAGIDKADYLIDNDRDLNYMYKQFDDIIVAELERLVRKGYTYL